MMLQASQVYIMDRPVFFNYSTSQEITRLARHLLHYPAPLTHTTYSNSSEWKAFLAIGSRTTTACVPQKCEESMTVYRLHGGVLLSLHTSNN